MTYCKFLLSLGCSLVIVAGVAAQGERSLRSYNPHPLTAAWMTEHHGSMSGMARPGFPGLGFPTTINPPLLNSQNNFANPISDFSRQGLPGIPTTMAPAFRNNQNNFGNPGFSWQGLSGIGMPTSNNSTIPSSQDDFRNLIPNYSLPPQTTPFRQYERPASLHWLVTSQGDWPLWVLALAVGSAIARLKGVAKHTRGSANGPERSLGEFCVNLRPLK
jgi:hypothetical protein